MRLRSQMRAGILAFLTAAFTLFTQVLVHRIISAKLYNNYAFVVISLTMLGFALSSVFLTRYLNPLLEALDDAVGVTVSGLVLTMLAVTVTFYRVSVSQVAQTRPEFVTLFLATLPWALLFALPFAFCGLILGLLLAAPHLSSRRVYAADLTGSAFGAWIVIPAINGVGVEAALLLACAVMIVGTVLVAPPRRLLARVCIAIAGLALIAGALGQSRLFDLRYPRGTTLAAIERLGPPYGVETVDWDAVARIEVSRIPPPLPGTALAGYPCLLGDNPELARRVTRMLTQNNNAFTWAPSYDGQPSSLRGLERTVYATAYAVSTVPRPRVAVIGVGGGIDVLTALAFDAGHVTAIEINSATVRVLRERHREYFRHWVDDPRVELVVAEGRHLLTRSPGRFDILQVSGVDSYAGTAAAAHVFSENYLYTAEAFDLFLSRLTDDGILNVMRLEYVPPREMLRALVTAVEALRSAGQEHPAEHILMVTARPEANFTALLVKRTPFTESERQRLAAWAATNPHLQLSAAPGLDRGANAYQAFLSLDDPRSERMFVAAYPWDLRPATDDRPFFFRHSYWWHLFPGSPAVWASIPAMEYSVIILTLVIAAMVVVSIYLPLRLLAGSVTGSPATRRFALYCAGCGLGYLAVEVALLQKFGLLLGHPNYALSVVLAALLFSSGVGSLYSARIVDGLGGVRFVAYALSGLILALHLLVLPLVPRLISLPFAVRVALVVALIAPLGLCLGTFLPTALERLKAAAPAYVPWAWGVNGIFSVLAPILAVAFSMTWGIAALLLSAIPVYIVAAASLPAARPE